MEGALQPLQYRQLLERFSRKRKRQNEMYDNDIFNSSHKEIDEVVPIIAQATAEIISIGEGKQPRAPNKPRDDQKSFWTNGYRSWTEEEFKDRLRINRETFEFILKRIEPHIYKEPTHMVPNPIETHRQLGLTIYRMAHGCSFKVLKDVFGVSQSLCTETFNKVIKVLVSTLYKEFVYLPVSEENWISECKSFIENYEFPCVGAWDGFHVHVTTNLKNFYSFKNRYTITSMGLVGCNKRFFYLTTGAPGSTHDARLLRNSPIFTQICKGEKIPKKTICLDEEIGDIPLVTIGDSAFPSLEWLIKSFNENTRDPKERYFNKKLRSARVVTENAYGMLKGRWRFIFKMCEAKLYNIKYIIMAAVLLHNICIHFNDTCKPRWKLTVEQLELIDTQVERLETRMSKSNSMDTAKKIADWLWKN